MVRGLAWEERAGSVQGTYVQTPACLTYGIELNMEQASVSNPNSVEPEEF